MALAFSMRLQLVDQLVAFELILAAEGIRVGALLNLAVLVAERGDARAGEVAGLIDDAADGGNEDLARAGEMHLRLGKANARREAEDGVGCQERGELAIHRHGERIDPDGRHPHRLVLFLRRQRHFVGARRRARPRDL